MFKGQERDRWRCSVIITTAIQRVDYAKMNQNLGKILVSDGTIKMEVRRL
jgi:hypothetical protein